MTLPRRVQMTLGAVSMLVLFGILGLAWWWWRHRPGHQPSTRLRRSSAALVVAGLVVLAAGTVGRLVVAIQSVPACAPPGGTHVATRSTFDASLLAQLTATWPETGIGLLYSRADGAHVCLSRQADYYVAVNADNIAGARAMTLGDIVLTPGFDFSREQRSLLIGHEARHRVQWAVATAVAGPFAFPVAYGIVNFFFPGSRNFFERQAELHSGGYRHVGYGPVLGPAQIAVLCFLAVVIVAILLGVRHRRASARSPGLAGTPSVPRTENDRSPASPE